MKTGAKSTITAEEEQDISSECPVPRYRQKTGSTDNPNDFPGLSELLQSWPRPRVDQCDLLSQTQLKRSNPKLKPAVALPSTTATPMVSACATGFPLAGNVSRRYTHHEQDARVTTAAAEDLKMLAPPRSKKSWRSKYKLKKPPKQVLAHFISHPSSPPSTDKSSTFDKLTDVETRILAELAPPLTRQ